MQPQKAQVAKVETYQPYGSGPSPYGSGPSPYGSQPQQQSSPYTQRQQSSPYEQPQQQSSPYAHRQPQQSSPYEQPQQQSSPYAQRQPQQSSPYEQPQQQSSPYAQRQRQQSSPYDQPQQQSPPYAQRQHQAPQSLHSSSPLQQEGPSPSPRSQPYATSSSFTGLIVMKNQEQVRQLETAMDNLVKGSVDIVSQIHPTREKIDNFQTDVNITIQLFVEFQSLIVDDEDKQKARQTLDTFHKLEQDLIELLHYWKPMTPFPEQIQSRIAKCLFSLINEHLLIFVGLMDNTHIKRTLLTVKKNIDWCVELRSTTNSFRFDVKFGSIQSDMLKLVRYMEERAKYFTNPHIANEVRSLAEVIRENLQELNRTTLLKCEQGPGSEGERLQTEMIKLYATTLSRTSDLIKNNPLSGSASFEHLKMFRAFDNLSDALRHGSTVGATAAARAIIEEVKAIKQTAPAGNEKLHQPLDAITAMAADLVKETKQALQGQPASSEAVGNLIEGLKQEVAKVDHYKQRPDVPYVAMKDSGIMDAALEAAKKLSDMFEDDDW